MNTYQYQFLCYCPVDGATIRYKLKLKTDEVVFAEALVNFCNTLEPSMHEGLASLLFNKFKGKQVLVARHSGVLIRTIRK